MDTGTAIIAGSGTIALILAILGRALFPLAREYARRIRDERIRAFVLALIREAEKQWGPGRGADKAKVVMQKAAAQGEPITRVELENAFDEWQMFEGSGATEAGPIKV